MPTFDDTPGGAKSERLSGTMVVNAAPVSRDAPSIGVFTVMSGAETGRVVTIPGGRMLDLGRSTDCWLSFDDASVSGTHAQLMRFGAAYMFTDAKSTNGSFINDARATAATPLKDGDRIQLGLSSFLRFSMVTEEEEVALRATYESGRRDGLTGVFNRKHLEERLDTDVPAAARNDSQLSLIMIDVDFFKKVNDNHGHLGGDAVLKEVAATLQQTVRAEDLLARYGGEEFTIVLKSTDKAAAAALAERLRAAVEQLSIAFDDKQIQVTSSAGVASLAECEKKDRESLLGLADARLYQAKQTGRNRVVSS